MNKKSRKKSTPLSIYYRMIYDNKKIEVDLFIKVFFIHFINAFAWNEKDIEKVLNDIFEKEGSKVNFKKLKSESEVPNVFYKYISERPLNKKLHKACTLHSTTTNVKNRIRHFLGMYVNVSQELVNDIQNLMQELDLTESELAQLKQLSQNKNKTAYFCDTFQKVLTTSYKENMLVSEAKEDSKLIQPIEDISHDTLNIKESDDAVKISNEAKSVSVNDTFDIELSQEITPTIENVTTDQFQEMLAKIDKIDQLLQDKNKTKENSHDKDGKNVTSKVSGIDEGIARLIDKKFGHLMNVTGIRKNSRKNK